VSLAPTHVAHALDLSFAWDANTEPDLAGYRLFDRQEHRNYDYNNPVWEGTETTCTIYSLDDNTTYYFVARAYNVYGDESENSNEVRYEPEMIEDRDGDGIPDNQDAFPDDPDEWVDSDEDGVGHNSDEDDDNDGMPDVWEIQYSLNPFEHDANDDPDEDFFANLQEYLGGTDPNDPGSAPPNHAPTAPSLNHPANDGETTSQAPFLSVSNSSDVDGDSLTYTFEVPCSEFSGTLSQLNPKSFHPIGPQAAGTVVTGSLSCDSGSTNLDLYLEACSRLNKDGQKCARWKKVEKSKSSTCQESISYTVAQKQDQVDFRWRVQWKKPGTETAYCLDYTP
jgi:hypothetical protein